VTNDQSRDSAFPTRDQLEGKIEELSAIVEAGNAEPEVELAELQGKLSILLALDDDFAGAIAQISGAIELFEKRSKGFDLESEELLAEALLQRAEYHLAAEDEEACDADMNRGVKGLSVLAEMNPEKLGKLAAVRAHRAELWVELELVDEAFADLAAMILQLEAAIEAGQVARREELGDIHRLRSELFVSLGRGEEALAAAKQSCAVQKVRAALEENEETNRAHALAKLQFAGVLGYDKPVEARERAREAVALLGSYDDATTLLERCHGLLMLAELEGRCDDFPSALGCCDAGEALLKAIDEAEGDPPSSLILRQATLELTRAELLATCDQGDPVARIRRVIEGLEDLEENAIAQELIAHAYEALGSILHDLCRDVPGAIAAYDRALSAYTDIYDDDDDLSAPASALMNRSYANLSRRDPHRAHTESRRALAFLDESEGLEDVLQRVVAGRNIAMSLIMLGNVREARLSVEDSLRGSNRVGPSSERSSLQGELHRVLAIAAAAEDRHEEALSEANKALDLTLSVVSAGRLLSKMDLAESYCTLALAERLSGHYEAAEAALKAGEEIARSWEQRGRFVAPFLARSLRQRALLAFDQDQREAGVELLSKAFELVDCHLETRPDLICETVIIEAIWLHLGKELGPLDRVIASAAKVTKTPGWPGLLIMRWRRVTISLVLQGFKEKLSPAALATIREIDAALSAYNSGWAEFMTDEEYRTFSGQVLNYWRTRGRWPLIADGELMLEDSDGKSNVFGLANLARLCGDAVQGEWTALISGHFEALEEGLAEQESTDLTDFESVKKYLAVRIYDAAYAERLEGRAITRVDLGGTVTMLVLDLPTTIRTLASDDVKEWGKSVDELLEIGLNNVLAKYESEWQTEQVELDSDFEVSLLSAPDFYVTTAALAFDKFPEMSGVFGAIIGIPHRHALIALPLEGLAGMRSVGSLIPVILGMYREGPGSISPWLYWWRAGEILPLPVEMKGDTVEFSPPAAFIELMNDLSGGDPLG